MRLLTLLSFMTLLGCSTVTISPKGESLYVSDPTFQRSYPHYVFGLIGENAVNIEEVCEGRGATQLQTQFTFVDSLLGLVTLGIYSPRTAKVWCVEKSGNKKQGKS